MMSLNTIKVGQRFSMCTTDFEICDVSSGIVRYAEVIGGKMNHIPIKKFINLLDNKIINDLEKTKDITPDELNKAEAAEMKRRLTYLREVIAKTNNHVSRKEVPPALKRIAEELKDKKQPSFATYARWYKTYISSDKNPLSLVPMDRNKGNRCYKFDPAIELIISKHIFTDWLNAVKPTISVVYANITGEIVEQYSTNNTLPYDTRFPTLKVITNRIHALDPFKKDKFRNGKHYVNRPGFTGDRFT